MKNDYSKIHPQLQPIARKYPRITFNKRTAWLMNLVLSWLPGYKLPGDLHIENRFVMGQDSGTKIRLRVYQPESTPAPTPVLVWLHGGGYVIGRPEMDDHICVEYVRALGITVVSVDYRLAPRDPFPAGLEDSYAALVWVGSQSRQLGVDPRRIAVGGASAGGGLAAALTQLAYDRGEIKPLFQLLVYPMLDDRTVLRAEVDDSSSLVWTQKSNRYGWESYLGQACGAETVPAYAVPARRTDLSGLPPAWIGVGSLDMFHDEDLAYGRRLLEFGVECELLVVPGAFHGFDVFDQGVPLVRDFRRSQIAALRRHLCL